MRTRPSLRGTLQQRKTATVENHARMRALIVTNMWPSPSAPPLGSFVRDLVATVSAELAREVPGAGRRRRVAVLPCGVALDRFAPIARSEARERLGLPGDEPCVLFPADPARPAKRFDRATEVAAGARLLS